MAQIALPRHQVTQSQSAAVGSPLYQQRQAAMVEMVPNPDFSFPMRAPDSASTSPTSKSRPMSLQAYPTGRRGSMPHARQKSVNALPEFSFNPAASAQPATGTSPPTSPGLSPNTPARPIHGHRRGGSELIGGNARTGGMSLMSTSPTKDGSLSPPAATLHTGPPAGRRGHAHRRSGAVSSHDLSSIMSPPQKTGSAPVTPLVGNDFKFGHSVNKSMSQPCLRNSGSDEEMASRPPSRARVGFSDKVEYIRPLSTISSETETSLSTFRGHSATNSLSSIVGGSSASPQFGRPARPLSTVEDEEGRRPSTAGDVLDKIMSNSRDETASDSPRPLSAVPRSMPSAGGPSPTSPNMATKRRHFFRLESRRSENFVHKLPASASDPALSRFIETPQTSPVEECEAAEEEDKTKSSSRKSGLKPRKVKSWANSIIPRKGKQSKKSKSRASSPPTESAPDADDTDTSEDVDFSPNFDDDNSVTIVSPVVDVTPRPKINTDYASWQPRQLQRVDSDVMSPIIDMDAALGPFNTPTGSSPRNQQRGFAAHRRAMHSANGPAPSHRRTESAPELVPFEFRPSAVASTSPMADVFEEEEPEDDPSILKEATETDTPDTPDTAELKVQVVETDSIQESSTINWNFNDGLGLKRINIPRGVEADEPVSPRAQTQPTEDRDSNTVEVVEDYEEPRTSSLTHSSDSTVTPQATAEEMKEHHHSMAVPLPLSQQSLMTPDTVTSSFSSPDYRSSQASFDTPRVGTAASSINDMPSPRFGEPGPDLHMSTEDVPSLTSSRSTMTSAMQNAFALASPRKTGDRSASMCSAPSEIESRRRKRSSIASLSRLINSSYGEKSKLSIEQRPQSEYLDPAKDSKKKSKRLSKLKFWKSSKDSSRA